MRVLEFTCALDRKSTRLNSSHTLISYAVFCLKKKKKQMHKETRRGNKRLRTSGCAASLSHVMSRTCVLCVLSFVSFLLVFFFFFKGSGDPRNLHSFPPRRSSD